MQDERMQLEVIKDKLSWVSQLSTAVNKKTVWARDIKASSKWVASPHSSLLCCDLDKILWPKATWAGKGLFYQILAGNILSLKEVRAGTHGRKLEAGIMDRCGLLPNSLGHFLSRSYSAQVFRSRDGHGDHHGLDPPMSITIQTILPYCTHNSAWVEVSLLQRQVDNYCYPQ